MSIKTPKKRLLVTLSRDAAYGLTVLAKSKRVPTATIASRLIDTALELEEDAVLAEMAHKRASRKGVQYVSSTQAWAKLIR